MATNENDVLDEFFRIGRYRVRKHNKTYHTRSRSMDISKASNFERFLFDFLGRDAKRTSALFYAIETQGEIDLSRTDDFSRVEPSLASYRDAALT